jgi:hypothetical protein
MKEEFSYTVIFTVIPENKMFLCMGVTISKNLKNAEFFL